MLNLQIPMPEGEENAPLQIMVTTIDHDEYVGRIGIGRVVRGTVKAGQVVSVVAGGLVLALIPVLS